MNRHPHAGLAWATVLLALAVVLAWVWVSNR